MKKFNRELGLRLVVHVLLAAFLANAANKFFIIDLKSELNNGVYQKIFEGVGVAPDQYRILPLLPLKFLCQHLVFNHAVLIFNSVCAFLVFEFFWWFMGKVETQRKYIFQVLFAVTYIYSQFMGWRPDTLALLLVCCATLSGRQCLPEGSVGRLLWATLGLIALSFSRADIGLVYGLFLGLYETRNWALRVLWATIPIAGQLFLQYYVYPDAVYYTEVVMLWDNLSGYYLIRHPVTYLIAAILLLFWRPMANFMRQNWDYHWYFILCLAYFVLVLFVGRLNEYRLYLPLVPIFFVDLGRKWKHTKNLIWSCLTSMAP